MSVGRQLPRWPLFLIAAPAAVAVWSGWVGLGGLCGFGPVNLLPGVGGGFHVNTAITLPVGVEAYGAYALGAWLTPGTPERARTFARRSAVGALGLGMFGQVVYHLLAAAGATRAPWPVVVLVSCMPVVTLGFGAALTHLLRIPAEAFAESADAPIADEAPAVPESYLNGSGLHRDEAGPLLTSSLTARSRASAVSALNFTSASRRPRRYRAGSPHSPVPRSTRPGCIAYPAGTRAGLPIEMEDTRMSSQPTDPPADRASVVPLRAVDAHTEVRLGADQAAGPSYVDLTRGEAQRRPLIPPHWRTREAARTHIRLAVARHGHRAAYHSLRSLSYFAKSAGFAVWGVIVTARRLIAWWHVPGTTKLEWEAAANGLLNEHLRLHKQGKETRRARGTILALCLAGLAAAVAGMARYAPPWAWAPLGLVLFAAFALAGRPQGKTITTKAQLPAQVQPPDRDVIVRALGSIGVAEINKAIGSGTFPPLPSPVREDGPGWRAEVDLPYGVTAAMVVDRREQLASGLRRPLGAVWPEPVTSEHAGRLELWVGRADVSKAKPPVWPLMRSGEFDVFGELPFGVDVRGRLVKVPMIYHNWLIGSIPRQGKTSAVRVLNCATALDPLVEKWTHELKGSGDLDPMEAISHRFVSGIDDASIGYAAESLKLLKAEIEKRTERLRAPPRELCPDKRVTREIAKRRSLKLWPIECTIDECQNLFAHPKYGKQAAEDAVFIIKIGPAFGIYLILATQRPDAKSLPMGVSSNVSQRFCLKVMDQIANDMVLGTSAYKQGIRATGFRAEIDAGLGYQVGAAAQPLVVRAFYLNLPDTERVAKRAWALREAAGTLSRVALGQDDTVPQRDVLADVGEVLAGTSGLHWQALADRLAERFPERWADAAGEAVRAELSARGVPSVVVAMDGQRARGCRAVDVEKAASKG